MDEVEKARSIQPDSRFDVTSNQLVIASNQKQTIQLNPQNLHDSLSGKIRQTGTQSFWCLGCYQSIGRTS